MITKLVEASRQDLIGKYRRDGKKGNERFQKRTNYSLPNFKGLDLDALFNKDQFNYKTPIKDYVCVVEFNKPLTAIKDTVRDTGGVDDITMQMITEAFLHAYNRDKKVKVSCSCPDYTYRHRYWATRHGYNAGAPENRPSDETNPNDDQGPACKHIAKLLDSIDWIAKAAYVVLQFIKAYPDKAVNYLYDNPEEKRKVEPEELEEEPEEETVEEVEETEETEETAEEPEETEETQETEEEEQ